MRTARSLPYEGGLPDADPPPRANTHPPTVDRQTLWKHNLRKLRLRAATKISYLYKGGMVVEGSHSSYTFCSDL